MPARDRLVAVREMPDGIRELVAGGYDACLGKLQAELAQAQVARRAANPFKTQLEGAEAHQARLVKKLADAKATLQTRDDQMAQVSKQIDLQSLAVAEGEAAVAKATAGVAKLAAQFASERSAPVAS